MSESRAVAITSLAQIEDRLRRALNLAGEVGLQFTPNAIPVVVAADASDIGCATYRGRRFMWGASLGTIAAAASVGFKAQDTVVVTSMRVTCATAGIRTRAQFALASVADPFAMTTPFALWSERAASATDFAPLSRSALPDASTSSGVIVAEYYTAANSIIEYCPSPLLLSPGDKLIWTAVSASGLTAINLSGYVF